MIVDLSPILSTLLSLASVAVTAAVPILVPAQLRRMRVANTADQSVRLEAAANAAAGLAYQWAMTQTGGLSRIEVHNTALARGVTYVADHLPDTIQALGLTTGNVTDMVSARLGVLLAHDPTVSAGAPARMPNAPVAVLPPSTPSI